MVIRKTQIKAIVTIASTLLVSGCFQNVHEFGPSEYAGKTSVGYMTTSLQWADSADAGTGIRNLDIAFIGSGNKFSRHFSSDEEASQELQQLPSGDYDVLATINMTAADGFAVTGMPATKATSGLGDISVSLKDSTHAPKQAWYGIGKAVIKEKSVSVIDIKLQRLLPVLKLYMTNIPADASVSFTFNNLAKEIKLTSSANTKYGVAGSKAYAKVTVDAGKTGPDGVFNTDYVILPTVSGLERCEAVMIITTATGATCYNVNMPCIECGKTYNMALDYNNLKSENYVHSSSINDWEDGWTVTTDIPDPITSEAAGNGIPMQVMPSVAGADTRASIETDDLKEFYLQIVCQDSTYSYFEKISKIDAVWGTDRKLYWKDETTPITYTAAYFSGHAFTKAEFKNGVDLALPTDQNTQAKLDSADLLTVKATQIKYENTVGGKLPVALNHGLAKVNFVLTLGDDFYDNKYGLKKNPVKNFTVKGANKGFNFKPQTGTVTVTANTKAAITPLAGKYVPGTDKAKAATATFEAILVPQTFAAGELSITFCVGQGKYIWRNTDAITLDAGKTYNLPLSVTAALPKPMIDGHEYVDLGLPSGLKWATCNVGADDPEEYGDYFAWGDTVPYYKPGHAQDDLKTYGKDDKKKTDGYVWSTYKWCNGSEETLTKYCNKSDYGKDGFTDGKTTLDAKDDAASYQWGGSWRMPTKGDIDELLATQKNTTDYTWTWCDGNTTKYAGTDVKGWQLVRNSTGATLFLPAAGYRDGTLLGNVGGFGYYWSSSLYTGSPDVAWGIGFDSFFVGWCNGSRYHGFPVRPVCP